MDKFHTELSEAEIKLTYIETQCKYFENQAWIERAKIKKLYECIKTHTPKNEPIITHRSGIAIALPPPPQLSPPISDNNEVLTGPLAWPTNYLINIVPSVSTKVYICDGCHNQIRNYRWTDVINFDLCQKCYNICCSLKIVKLKNSKHEYLMSDLKKVVVI